MEAIKQIVRIPKNHEIRIKVPQEILEDEIAEVILIVKKRSDNFKQKIEELKEAMKDTSFLNDLSDISDDLKAIDLEGWK